MAGYNATIELLNSPFPTVEVPEFRGQARVVPPAGDLIDVLRLLKAKSGFDFLVDLSCADEKANIIIGRDTPARNLQQRTQRCQSY